MAWEGYETRLRRGEATFVLYTMDNAEPAAKRNLDVIFLTTDLSDLPKEHCDPFFNELREPGRLFVRVKNPPGAGRSVLLGLSFSYNRRPWGGGGARIGQRGLVEAGPTEYDYIRPGRTSLWTDISPWLDTVHQTAIRIGVETANREPAPAVELEVGGGPGGEPLFRRFNIPEGVSDFGIVMPVDFNPEEMLSFLEVSRKQVEYVRAFPEKGRLPRRILFYASVGAADPVGSELARSQFELKRLLGYNTLTGLGGQAGLEAMRGMGIEPARTVLYHEYRLDLREEHFRQIAEQFRQGGMLPYLRVVSVGDEVSLSEYVPQEGREEDFRKCLQAKGLSPAEVKAARGRR